MGQGRKPLLKGVVELALFPTLLTYIQLSNVEMMKMPDRKSLIMQLKVVFTGTPMNMYRRYYHLYDRMMRNISEHILVNGNDYKMEHRRNTSL